jgi:hypothetical protein
MEIEYRNIWIDLYRNGSLLGQSFIALLRWPSENRIIIHVPSDPAGSYNVILAPLSENDEKETGEQYEGWTYARARLDINGGMYYGTDKPIAWYTAEPTDWASGIVRWVFPPMQTPANGTGIPTPPVTYSTLIRRP